MALVKWRTKRLTVMVAISMGTFSEVPRLTLLDAETGDTILESAHDDTAFVPAVDTGKPDLERVWAEIAGLRPPAVGSRGYAS